MAKVKRKKKRRKVVRRRKLVSRRNPGSARLSKSVADAVARALDGGVPRLFHVSADVRRTQNLGGFEFESFGFGITCPVSAEPNDDIEKKETRDRLGPKYAAAVEFLVGMAKVAEQAIAAGIRANKKD